MAAPGSRGQHLLKSGCISIFVIPGWPTSASKWLLPCSEEKHANELWAYSFLGKECATLSGILSGSGNPSVVPVCGGLSLLYKKRRGSHLHPGGEKEVAFGFFSGGSLAVTEEDTDRKLQMSKGTFLLFTLKIKHGGWCLSAAHTWSLVSFAVCCSVFCEPWQQGLNVCLGLQK